MPEVSVIIPIYNTAAYLRKALDSICGQTLKNREYAARGFGFVYSETDDDFDRMPYTLKVPADESPVSIPALIEFFQHMTVTPREIRDSIRHLCWEEQMKKVYEQIVRIKK